jgi:hypothetical protein
MGPYGLVVALNALRVVDSPDRADRIKHWNIPVLRDCAPWPRAQPDSESYSSCCWDARSACSRRGPLRCSTAVPVRWPPIIRSSIPPSDLSVCGSTIPGRRRWSCNRIARRGAINAVHRIALRFVRAVSRFARGNSVRPAQPLLAQSIRSAASGMGRSRQRASRRAERFSRSADASPYRRPSRECEPPGERASIPRFRSPRPPGTVESRQVKPAVDILGRSHHPVSGRGPHPIIFDHS